MTPWTWWAGEVDEDTYGLAEAATREDAIREASQGLKPGDKFRIVEARASTAAQYEGSDCVPFLRTRNHEIITVGPVEVSPAPQTKMTGLPQDVIDLVIAAREAFDTGMLPSEENSALDKALEAFSSRVPYENEPGEHQEVLDAIHSHNSGEEE